MNTNSLVKANYMRRWIKFSGRTVKVWMAALAVCCLVLPAAVSAITTISQGYSTTDSVALGSIVSLQNNSSDHVVAAINSNADSILGVVINDGTSLLSLSSNQANQIQVATSGVVQVLVSNINGDVNQGDEITASPIAGVGMIATDNAKVVGIAQANLASGSNNTTQSYTDKKGQKHSIVIGEIPVLVNVSYFYKQPNKTLIPSAIQNVANAFAGKTVSTLPILISLGIFLVTLLVVVSIVYSMVHSSIISVGRNPMSQAAVYRNVMQMSVLVLGILAVAVIAIYMVLAKF
jgi:hypothetical protein